MDTCVMNGSEGAGGTGTGTATAADGGEVRFERCSNARVVERRDDGSPWLIRSAAPDDLTDADEARLRGLGVSTIVDLREPGEGPGSPRGLPNRGSSTTTRFPGAGWATPSAGARWRRSTRMRPASPSIPTPFACGWTAR